MRPWLIWRRPNATKFNVPVVIPDSPASDAMILRSLAIVFTYLLGATGQFIYLNTGVFKFIAGIGLPINVGMSSGSLSWFNNMQVFYKLPDNITQYEPYRIMHKRSVKNTLTRLTLYRALDKYLDRLGLKGNECVHRLVCETARRKWGREENGLLGEMADIVFTPDDDGETGVEEYKAARRHGARGSQCGAVYEDCNVDESSVFLL